MKVKVTFDEPLLGTVSGNKELAEGYILANNPNGIAQDEQDGLVDVEGEIEKSSTFFYRDGDKEPILMDYQVKGFFKDACEQMIHSGAFTKDELRGPRLTQYLYKKTIDKQIFVFPRLIKLQGWKSSGFLERPLRAETMKGERICLARSEIAPVGTWVEIEIVTMNEGLGKYVEQWLKYGKLFGMGQWRSGGYGRFHWEDVS